MTSPEALREAEPVKCLGERFQDAFLRGWGDDRLVAYADLPAESQAKWNRAALAFVCTLSDAPTELQSAIQVAREALGPFAVMAPRYQYQKGHVLGWENGSREIVYVTPEHFRRAAEVYRALSPGGADAE